MGNQTSIDFSKGEPATEKETEHGESVDQQLQYAVSGMRGFRDTMELS